MKLYTHSLSSSARRVNLTVAQLGIPLETRMIDLRVPEDRAALVAVNPNNKIPVLVDPTIGLALWESHAICQFLCDRDSRGATLYPTELVARADVNRWMFWVNAHLAPAVGAITYELLWKRRAEPQNPEPDPAVIARSEKLCHLTLGVLDKHLENRTWVSGKTLTIADFSIASTFMYRTATKLPLDASPNILAYLARVEATDAWKATEPQKLG